MTDVLTLPWCDCKVAYGVDDVPKFERWIERTDWCAGLLPPGWQLVETDGSGARMVAIFRVEVMPTVEDGKAVYRLLAKHGGYREKRARATPVTAAREALARQRAEADRDFDEDLMPGGFN